MEVKIPKAKVLPKCSSLAPGDTFLSGGEVYLKIERQMVNCANIDAVRLLDGSFADFGSESVTKVDCKCEVKFLG